MIIINNATASICIINQNFSMKNKKQIFIQNVRGVSKIILGLVNDVEPLIKFLISPSPAKALRFFDDEKYPNQKRYYYRKKFYDLINKGYIQKNPGVSIGYSLTPKGKNILLQLKPKKLPKKWDGLWRIVMFDVYETNRTRRNALRNQLKEYGFVQLQKSVWLFPFPCDEFITLLKTDLRFNKNVRYIVAKRIDNDLIFKKYFKL